MNKKYKSLEYYRANPLDFLEDFYPEIKFTPFQRKEFEKFCKEAKSVNSEEKALMYINKERTQEDFCLENTLAGTLYTSTIGGKGSKEVEVNGYKCNIQ